MNKNATKRSLLASVLALVMCVAMLVGATFAWFTDTASVGVNKIVAGNLHVQIQNEAGQKIENLEWKTADNRTQDKILWEPGCTYTLTPFKIVNTGNLALKYKIVITGLDENSDAELLKVIKFTYSTEDGTFDMDAEGHLAANGGATKLITVSAGMDKDAGNDYMDKTLEGVKFTVYATQDTVEYDRKDNQYDAGADYAATNYETLVTAMQNGGNVTIGGNITADETKTAGSDRLTVLKPTTLRMNGMYTVPGELEDSSNWAALFIKADTTFEASENGGINCIDKKDPDASYIGGPYVAHITDGATVTVNGGSYYGGGTTFNVQQGTLIVNGGFFQVAPDIGTHDYRYLLNCIDENYQNGTAQIIVKGGTFVNFDPSNNTAEGSGTNFVADGYTVISAVHGSDTWYTVVPNA